MSTMVERVARAMAMEDVAKHHGGEISQVLWEQIGPHWQKKARTAIAAMREPTQPMKDAGAAAGSWWDGLAAIEGKDAEEEAAVTVLQAMIDEALK